MGMGTSVGMGMGFGPTVPGASNDLLGMGSQLTMPNTGSPHEQQVPADPLAVLDGAFVPLESIKPGESPVNASQGNSYDIN